MWLFSKNRCKGTELLWCIYLEKTFPINKKKTVRPLANAREILSFDRQVYYFHYNFFFLTSRYIATSALGILNELTELWDLLQLHCTPWQVSGDGERDFSGLFKSEYRFETCRPFLLLHTLAVDPLSLWDNGF